LIQLITFEDFNLAWCSLTTTGNWEQSDSHTTLSVLPTR